MKLTESHLRKIIKEELKRVLNEEEQPKTFEEYNAWMRSKYPEVKDVHQIIRKQGLLTLNDLFAKLSVIDDPEAKSVKKALTSYMLYNNVSPEENIGFDDLRNNPNTPDVVQIKSPKLGLMGRMSIELSKKLGIIK